MNEPRLIRECYRHSGRRQVWAKSGLSALAALSLALMPALLAVTPTLWAARSGSLAAAASAPRGKETQSTAGEIRRQVLVVNVPVTVIDKRGLPVIDLTQNDFQVYENGKRQTIAYFRQDPLPPLRIGLVLDTSNSMRPQMEFETDAATQFVYNILSLQNTNNKIFLETFDESASVVQGFTADPDLLQSKIRTLKAGGGKALYDAIYSACKSEMMKAGQPEDTRRLLVVISDGLDVQSQHTLDEAISMAHRAETAVYTIGNSPYGYSNPGDKYLRELAEATGGGAFFPLEQEVGADLATGYIAHGTMNDEGYENRGLGAQTGIYSAQRLMHLADALDALGRDLDSEYSIGYAPSDQNLDGAYRRIRVEVRRHGVTLRYKTGYFALAQPQ